MAATITQQNRTASGELALVQAFVNTRYGRGLRAHAEVTNPAQLCDWLVAYGLLSEGLLRYFKKPLGNVVRNERMWQSHQSACVPATPQRSACAGCRDQWGLTSLKRYRRAAPA